MLYHDDYKLISQWYEIDYSLLMESTIFIAASPSPYGLLPDHSGESFAHAK